jgi:hypothetical protein
MQSTLILAFKSEPVMRYIRAFLTALCFAAPGSAMAYEFSAENAYIADVKLVQPADMAPYVSVFANRFTPNTLERKNEFSKPKTSEDAAVILAKEVSQFDFKEPFTVSTEAVFGEYNFARSEFDFRPVSAGTSFRSGPAWYNAPGDIEVVFVNTQTFHGLPMDAAAAERLVREKPNRKVYIEIEFVPDSAIEGSNKIRAKLSRIDVYADPAHSKLVYTFAGADTKRTN